MSATFSQDENLPLLPVPDLAHTCEVYLKSLKPILCEEEYRRSERAVRAFLSEGGEELQRRLVQLKMRADESKKGNWLTEIWQNKAYLEFREPCAFLVNYSMVCSNNRRAESAGQLARSALIVHHVAQFCKDLQAQRIPAQFAGADSQRRPECMDQLRRVLGTTRRDSVDHFVVEPLGNTHHVVCICNDWFFELPVIVQGAVVEARHLYEELGEIQRAAMSLPRGAPISVFTADNRTEWSKARRALIAADKRNLHALDSIQRALCVLTLSSDQPRGLTECANLVHHGDTGRDHWWDKAVSFTVFANGRVGMNGEHSPNDAPIPGILVDYCLERQTSEDGLQLLELLAGVSSDSLSKDKLRFQPLKFHTNSIVLSMLKSSQRRFAALIAKNDLCAFHFTAFGKRHIRQFRCSPDAFVQMAFQLTYYRAHGTSCATYETASTRKFRFGRTETVRSTSSEARTFVKAMSCPRTSAQKRYDALRVAMDSHVAYVKMASNGNGVDRHLLALKTLLQPHERVPSIFLDPAFEKSRDFVMSTSNVSVGKNWFGIFAPVTEHGYGLPYSIRDDYIQFCVTTNKSSCISLHAEEFSQLLRRSLTDIFQLLSQFQPMQARL